MTTFSPQIYNLNRVWDGQLVCVQASVKGERLKSLEDSLTTPAWHLMLAVGLDLCWGWGQNSHTKALHVAAWLCHSMADQF